VQVPGMGMPGGITSMDGINGSGGYGAYGGTGQGGGDAYVDI